MEEKYFIMIMFSKFILPVFILKIVLQSKPPDLEDMWRDFNVKIANFFKFKNVSEGNFSGGKKPGNPNTKFTVPVFLLLILFIWFGTGFFIVQEGYRAVITEFGKYKLTVDAGFNWRLPYPIQNHELVLLSQIRSVDVGRDVVLKATGLKESAMLTKDENIVDVKFAVQYRLNDAYAFLFKSKNPEEAVIQIAETSVREVIGSMKMDSVLSEERDQIAPHVRKLMQKILNQYELGVEVIAINLQQGGVKPPEQVQASFDDVLKAGQERERYKNDAQAYANDVVPRAVGAASRLREEAEAYKSRVVAQAQGDAQRFRSIHIEYQKAPQVMRDRMYIDTMQSVYNNVTKIVVESHQGGTLLNLPLEKILQWNANQSSSSVDTTVPAKNSSDPTANTNIDMRSRDASRNRDSR